MSHAIPPDLAAQWARSPWSELARSSAVSVICVHPDRTIATWNAGAELLYGYPASEAIGRPIDLIIPAPDQPGSYELIRRTLAGDEVPEARVRRITRDGHLIDVSVLLNPVRNADGVPVGICSVTTRQDAGDSATVLLSALADPQPAGRDASLERLGPRTLFERILGSVPLGVAVHDLSDWSVVYASPWFKMILGYDPTDPEQGGQGADPMPRMRRVHPDDRERFTAYVMTPIEDWDTTSLEYRAVRDDGVVRWVRTTRAVVYNRQGVATHLASTVKDITDRRTSEQETTEAQQLAERTLAALRESQSRFEQLVNGIDLGFALRTVDPPEIIYVSPGWVQLYGFDPLATGEATEGSGPILRRVHPDDRERVTAATVHGLREPVQFEYRYVRPDGMVRWFSTQLFPVFDDHGVVSRTAAVTEDVTGRRAGEQELLAAYGEAERANAAKSEFLSRTSHELRTPLNAVLGFAQLLELDELSELHREYVEHILRSGRHLLALIDDVLDISRIEADDLSVTLATVGICEVIDEAVRMLEPLSGAAGVTISLHPPASIEDHFVTADRRRLMQVVLNIVSNAVKYNRPGGTVDISCATFGSQMLGISIADTGEGIAAHELGRVFAPFDRLGRESSGIEGTGIGLAIAQRLVRTMGGRLDVTSTLGSGSTFTVTLPRARPPAS